MVKPWNIVFYVEEDGSKPVFEYIFQKGRNEKDIAVMMAALQRLKAVGPDLEDTQMAIALDDTVWELRKDRHRILFARCGQIFVLLAAFLKTTQKTPREQVDLAHRRFDRWLGLNG
ncbi:MAG TPA: type II toxin-antitoxin system RelE/ParE family toxin [Anaerolineaceae bacterium]